MIRRKNKLEKLEKALFETHRTGETLEVSKGWHESVMQDIRNPAILTEERDILTQLGGLAWRFSAAACLAALILLVFVLSTGFIDYQELALQFIEDPLSYIM
jgi:uncharacterized membrane protein